MTVVAPPTPTPSTFQDDEIDLGQLLATLIAGRWVVAGCAALALFLGGAYALLSTPIYKVNALVQVEDSKGAGLGALEDLSGMFEGKSSAVTEIELMRSRMVLGRTASDLNLMLDVQPKSWPLLGRIFPSKAHMDLARLDVPAEWLGETLELQVLEATRFRVIGPDGELLGEGRVGELFKAAGVSLFVRDLRAKAGDAFVLSRSRELRTIEAINSQLSLSEKGKQSGIIELSYEGPDAEQAALVLNTIAQNYVRQNVERKSAEAQQTLQFLDQQLPDLKKQLESAEVRFNDFRARTGILDMTADGQRLLEQSVASESGLFELQQKRKELLARFTADHPSVQAIDRQIAGVNAQQGKFSGEVKKLPKEQQELLRLTRDLQVNQELYTQLLNSAQQLKVAKAGTVGNVRIVDMAIPSNIAVKPKKALIVMLSLILGAMLGVGLVILRQALQRGVKEANQIEQQLGLSVLATVPESDQQEKLIAKKRKQGGAVSVLALNSSEDLAVEALRSLRTSLHFTLIDAANNRLMITGPSSMLGKSFVSVNLAAVMSAAGQRVVVVDADMRCGYLNEYFGTAREQGLSEFIAGDLPKEQLLRNSGVTGFDYITTGTIPPNPAELLLHPRFGELMEYLSAQYDVVLVDSPPVLAVTDAAIVGRHMGASLLMARFAQTPMRELELAYKRLQQAGVPVNGVVLNGVDISRGYGFGNKYAYAYGYQKRKD